MLKDVPEAPMNNETPDLQEETTSPTDTESVSAPAVPNEAPASTAPKTESSPDLSVQEENTPPAPGLPEALPAAAAGTVSLSVGIYWLWRKYR